MKNHIAVGVSTIPTRSSASWLTSACPPGTPRLLLPATLRMLNFDVLDEPPLDHVEVVAH